MPFDLTEWHPVGASKSKSVAAIFNGGREEAGRMEQKESYMVEQPQSSKPSPQGGKKDTSATKADASAILSTAVDMMIKSGWVLEIGNSEGNRAAIVFSNSKWESTPLGWILVEA